MRTSIRLRFVCPARASRYPVAICCICRRLIENICPHSDESLWQHITTRFVECADRPGKFATPSGGTR